MICNDPDEPIGFIGLHKWLGKEDAYSWSYYIDCRQQRKGCGKSAARLAIHILKSANQKKTIRLSADVNDKSAHVL